MTLLWTSLREFDTAPDFVRYLRERERAIRGGRIAIAPGERELLGWYLRHADEVGLHVFPDATMLVAPESAAIHLPSGLYEDLKGSLPYLRKKEADAASYAWDRLITLFTEHVLGGTSVGSNGEGPNAASAERALRIMAAEPRIMRRMLGTAFVGALRAAEEQARDRFARVAVPQPAGTGYVFMVLAYPTGKELAGGYDQYRRVPIAMLQA